LTVRASEQLKPADHVASTPERRSRAASDIS
jgi:hypothetical protein